MAFPEVSVLLRFLNDYLEIRESTWHSMSATLVKSGTQLFNSGALVLSKLTSVFVSQDTNHAVKEEELEEEDDEKRIKSICTLLSEAIAKAGKANTLDAWAKVTFDLGEEARKATKRLKRSKISLFSQALHAMRSYAVALLQEEANYPKCTAQFQTQLEGVKTQLYRDRRAGLAIAEFLTQRDKLRLNLADLGNDEAIFECVDAGLFQTLFFPQREAFCQLEYSHETSTPEVNPNKPWFYQKTYYLRYFNTIINPIKMESFQDFITRARNNGKLIANALHQQAAAAAIHAASTEMKSDSETKDSHKDQENASESKNRAEVSPTQTQTSTTTSTSSISTTPSAPRSSLTPTSAVGLEFEEEENDPDSPPTPKATSSETDHTEDQDMEAAGENEDTDNQEEKQAEKPTPARKPATAAAIPAQQQALETARVSQTNLFNKKSGARKKKVRNPQATVTTQKNATPSTVVTLK